MRDRVVLTTSVEDSGPNAGGNGREHAIRVLDASLRREM